MRLLNDKEISKAVGLAYHTITENALQNFNALLKAQQELDNQDWIEFLLSPPRVYEFPTYYSIIISKKDPDWQARLEEIGHE